jgi:hypothetical protein
MTFSPRNARQCGFCVALNFVVPWGLIVIGAIVSALPLSPAWHTQAAYFVLGGLILLAGSVVFKRVGEVLRHYQ